MVFDGLGVAVEGCGEGVEEGTTAGTAVEGAARIIAGVEGEQRGGIRRREVGMHDGAWINNILSVRRRRGEDAEGGGKWASANCGRRPRLIKRNKGEGRKL